MKIQIKFFTVLVIFGITILSKSSVCQVWIPTNINIPVSTPCDSIWDVCEQNNSIYLVQHKNVIYSDSFDIRVYKWNGLFTTQLPTITAYVLYPGFKYGSSIKFYNNELYLAGIFDSVRGIANSSGIIKFNGRAWESVGAGIKARLGSLHMEVYKNELYIAGDLTSAGGIEMSNIARWNGSQWNFLGTPGNEGIVGFIRDIEVYHDSLFVIGQIGQAGGQQCGPVVKWGGTYWENVQTPQLSAITMCVYKNELFVGGIQSFSSYNGVDWNPINFGINGGWTIKMLQYNNQIVAIGSYSFTSGQYGNIAIWDGTTWAVLNENMSSLYDNIYSFQNNLYITGCFDSIYGIKNNIAKLSTKLGSLSGKVYHDMDKNCIMDSNEIGISNWFVDIQPLPFYLSTNNNGNYKIYVDSGNYNINLVKGKGNYKHWQLSSCNPDIYAVRIDSNTRIDSNHFALHMIPNINDLEITIIGHSGWRARQGFDESYTLKYTNIGSILINSGTVELQHDQRVNLISALPNYSSYNNPVIEWNFTNLQPMESRTIKLSFKINTSILLNDTIYFNAIINPLANDTDKLNNYDTLPQKIVGSFDPNDKQCYPQQELVDKASVIDYCIRFQNVGNDTAYRVVVIDSIDTKFLELAELVIIGTSHPYTLEMKENVLIWKFDNILLPDSTTDESSSHGYIRYKIKLKPGLANGTRIKNKADIFFDYQYPVTTNTALFILGDNLPDIIDEPEIMINEKLKIYPNPARDILNIEYTGNNDEEQLFLMNSMGKVVRSIILDKYERTTVDISNLSSGIYFVKSNNATNKLLIIR